jgi:hypothetical protein
VHSINELAAVITEELSRLVVLLWQDGTARLIFESGGRYDTVFPNVDMAIRTLTGPTSPLAVMAKATVHRVPAEATTGDQVLEWIQAIPEVCLEFANYGQA